MNIQLPEAQQRQLDFMAANAGYDSTEGFVQDCLLAMAARTEHHEATAWTEDELREFAAMCDRGMAQIDAGLGLTVEEAREELLRPFREQAG